MRGWGGEEAVCRERWKSREGRAKKVPEERYNKYQGASKGERRRRRRVSDVVVKRREHWN